MFIPKNMLSEIDQIEKDIVDNLVSRYQRNELNANALCAHMYQTHMMYTNAMQVISAFVSVRNGLNDVKTTTLN